MNEMNGRELWQATLGELELTISKANFTTWFKNTFISAIENGRVIISVPNAFTKLYIEKKYHSAILKSLQNILNAPLREVVYRVDARPQTTEAPAFLPNGRQEAAEPRSDTPLPEPPARDGVNEFGLRKSYTFENFIVGKGNELAHAAAQAVAEAPGVKYNPFLMYGGVGLGKTHLLQAIGHRVLERSPHAKVLYATSEQFVNDFINAVRGGHAKDFKERYRGVDILLIDDVQFIAGKVETMEEFFHTFNALHQAGKQIVLTSDRPPQTIGMLDDRLKSRLQAGMVADISSPDLETRIAILVAKCQERRWNLSRESLTAIADLIATNVRELEGALTRVVAHHELKNVVPTVETVKEVLASFSQNQAKKSVTPKQLIQTVASYFDLPLDDLLGKSREKKLAFPRQITMYLMRTELRSSFPTIGDELGGRDHTTAMHACTKITRELERDEKLRMDIETLKERIYGAERAW